MNRSYRNTDERRAYRKQAAEQMRLYQSEPEEAMGAILLDLGLDFVAQADIDIEPRGEIVDFLVRLEQYKYWAIEVDGPEHKDGPDERRDRRLMNALSIRTLRFKNADLMERPLEVRQTIIDTLGLN